MKEVKIYQTLEDRGNYKEVEGHGPYLCSKREESGRTKLGSKEPWLGEGYYFWEHYIDDAKWWGDEIYRGHYIIAESRLDLHTEGLLDLYGDIEAQSDFEHCAIFIKGKMGFNRLKVADVIQHMRDRFPEIRAVRVCPVNLSFPASNIIATFPGRKYGISLSRKVQICIYDKDILPDEFRIVYPETLQDDFSI